MKKLLTAILFSMIFASFAEKPTVTYYTNKDKPFGIIENNYEEHSYWRNQNNVNNNKFLYSVIISKKKKNHLFEIQKISLIPKSVGFKNIEELKNYDSFNSNNNETVYKIVPDDNAKYDEIYGKWKSEFQKELVKRSDVLEDNELEYLLHLKLFNNLIERKFKLMPWKKEKILKFLWTISGMSDIADAVPLKKDFQIKNHIFNHKKPEAITLPQIKIKPSILKKYSLAELIPRSCYYLEFKNAKTMFEMIKFSSDTFEELSSGTYPKTLEKCIDNYLIELGLNKSDLINNSDKLGKIVISGWDPFIQSGTSLLLVIENGSDLKVKAPFQFIKNGSIALTNSKKLFSMAETAYDKKRSLSQAPHFLSARDKIKQDENENLYFYLSDYWLTNFISPRWRILDARLAECDARIKLIEILRLSEQAENKTEKLPSIKTLSEKFKNHKELSWLMRDLIIDSKTDRVVHKEWGGLFNHPAIDTMEFKQVSEFEFKFYNKFKDNYSRLWREMDPIAFQIIDEGDFWRNRLYISPISRLSEFRELRDIVLKKKETHSVSNVKYPAAGLSLKFKTKLMTPFTGGMKVAPILQATVSALDMAPHVRNLKHIHKEREDIDYWSYSRIPAMIEIPSLLFQIAKPFMGRNLRTEDTNFEGISRLNIVGDFMYQLFYHQSDDGYTQLAINPAALAQMTNGNKERKESKVASDIYGFLNFENGHMMHRYLLIELAKNRLFASWRRSDRNERCKEYFGQNIAEGIFPRHSRKFLASGSIPKPYNEQHYYGGSASSNVRELPEILKLLQKIELFISVEPNALLFESHIKIKGKKKKVIEQEIDTDTDTGATPNGEPDDEGLDFDED